VTVRAVSVSALITAPCLAHLEFMVKGSFCPTAAAVHGQGRNGISAMGVAVAFPSISR
jgi:hypothetical protein